MIEELYDEDHNPVLYDLKDQFAEVIRLEGLETNVEKWSKYREYKVDRYSAYGVDCDVSWLAMQVYSRAWAFLDGVRPTKQYVRFKLSDIAPFDCISSATDTLLFASDSILGIEKATVCVVRKYKYQLIVKNASNEYYRGDTMTSFSNTYNHFRRCFVENKNISIEIEKLAKNHHTVGNMIPVPGGFNIGRAGRNAEYDYWDLTMGKIKEWYDSDSHQTKNQVLMELLNGMGGIDTVTKWLCKFATWDKFVLGNYLSHYVDKDTGNPSAFWDSHSYDNPELPKDEGSFLDYLRFLNTSIEERNKEILGALKSRL